MSEGADVTWEEFYEAIGRGMTAWSGVENALCDVFSRILICCIGGGMKAGTHQNLWLVGNIFNSITNLPARLGMIDDMVQREVSDPALLGEWKTLKNKVGTLYKKRNVLAHCGVWGSGTDSGEGASFLRAPFFSSKDEVYGFQQVTSWPSSFKALEDRTTEFAVAVNKWIVDNRPVEARLR
ncbi:MAG: hypothetical protein GC203_11795 [Phenylobacterium sp.]|uniref:hypothetical protein n=1 Tax=Phenylobacterium sp. TaxID=1871053 RepID=UPI0025F3E776|nr:hypothetical protein [Phenylobacterium sp.]MBI1198536.1 hypothetical protein [Phenylobacterium sp.]